MKKSAITNKLLILLATLFAACSPNYDFEQSYDPKPPVKHNKPDYLLANEIVDSLRNSAADTVILYKRTCIGCCDFYNILWNKSGKAHITKIYGSSSTPSITKDLCSDKLFITLKQTYEALKSSEVKEITHKNSDGSSTTTMIDHYCYSKIDIYCKEDSVLSGRIIDYYYEEYLYSASPDEKKINNDNYLSNKQSKWNLIIDLIEKEIEAMPESSKRELDVLRKF
jgi:hypothetical protein